MAIVQLKPTWPGNFRRTVRDAAGQELRVLTWGPGESQQLEGEDLAAVAGDLGKSLQLVVFDEAKGKLVPAAQRSEVRSQKSEVGRPAPRSRRRR